MKQISFIIFVLMFSCIMFGQGSTDNNRVFQAKVKFFNEKLELSNAEAEKFWPIYNDYQNRKNLLTSERNNLLRFFNQNRSNMSVEEVSKTLSRFIEIEKELTGLLDSYNEKFKSVLPDEKVLHIYLVEIEFRDHLLKQLRTAKPSMQPRN
ncbi:MAG: hypothetical protein JXA77_13390 [Bacteroidales bacterium]|nr:hypothetical protein [Bacteroidales bacterium]MBN2818503.1 hypothetical protein [Bacteroidales bacterium]